MDGFRAGLSVDGGQVVLRYRRGAPTAAAFPEVVAGAAQLPDAIARDGELIVWNSAGCLAFGQLQTRLQRRGPAALQAAGQQPAHFVTGVRTGSWLVITGWWGQISR
ncbi:hypothetical protein O1Q96_01325 (plasmid) [Streptomyces sp. Qhu-G9]|uniref:hypothetical protein n=1 Tax=Streptomyces sp. Qhu-G9 TaxID=3452799 RepID=UPI0022AC1627|nr:hypothetical protein [Streptomyces aurantiacus]WAU78498.1 hypothetical protein O1Q96_01325 [Streptomyces aurantiacus]